jgi:hypothetical protein
MSWIAEKIESMQRILERIDQHRMDGALMVISELQKLDDPTDLKKVKGTVKLTDDAINEALFRVFGSGSKNTLRISRRVVQAKNRREKTDEQISRFFNILPVCEDEENGNGE